MPDPSLVRFRSAVAAAYAELESRRQEVNDLNVFPVADGDTGDNMAMTMRAVLDELDRMNGEPIDVIGRDAIVHAVARAALLGARGNSGVILSQIVRGAAAELVSRPGELVDPVLVAAAFARAADAAYESVREPAEGTMLSAVRAMAHRVAQDLAHMDTPRLGPDADPREQDELLAEVLERALEAGKEAVQRGPEQLAVLREAGVVDAGAYGLTVVLAGVIGALRGDAPPEIEHQLPTRTLHLPQHESSKLPLLHQLRGLGRGARELGLRAAARAARRLGAGRGRRQDAARARAHRRPRAPRPRCSTAPARCRASTSRTCTSRSPIAAPGSRPRTTARRAVPRHARPAAWWRWPAGRGSRASTASSARSSWRVARPSTPPPTSCSRGSTRWTPTR